MLLQFKMVCILMPWAKNCLIPAHWFARDCVILRSFKDLQDFEYVDILQSALCGLLSGFPLVASIHHANQMTAISKSNLITFKDWFLPLDIDRWLLVSLKEGTDVSIGLESHSVLHHFTLLLKYLAGIPKTYMVFSVSLSAEKLLCQNAPSASFWPYLPNTNIFQYWSMLSILEVNIKR